MNVYEVGWQESHYMDVEADSVEEVEEMFDRFAANRQMSATTYTGIVGDLSIWKVRQDIEVSDSMIFNYNAEEFHYTVLNADEYRYTGDY